MNAIILAGGKSSRFGGNKLLEKFEGKTLLEYSFLFCLRNKVDKVYVTVSRDDVYYKDGEFNHTVLDEANASIYRDIFDDFKINFQESDKYGPAAAIMPWVDVVEDDFYVLLADNFTWGFVNDKVEKLMNDDTTVIGSIFKEIDDDNLRLAHIDKYTNKVIEKPHTYKEGNFFGGFCAFSQDNLKKLKDLKLSKRGEFEITHLINKNKHIKTFDLSTIFWKDLTYKHEISSMKDYIEESIS